MLGTKIKRSGDRLDYDIDCEDWMTDGDTIASAVAVSDAPSEMQVLAAIVVGMTVKVWVDGGVNKESYVVLVTITTTDGRIKTAEFTIRIRD